MRSGTPDAFRPETFYRDKIIPMADLMESARNDVQGNAEGRIGGKPQQRRLVSRSCTPPTVREVTYGQVSDETNCLMKHYLLPDLTSHTMNYPKPFHISLKQGRSARFRSVQLKL